MLYGHTQVSVAFDPQPEQQPDALLHRLAEFVHRAEAHRHHDAGRKSAPHIVSSVSGLKNYSAATKCGGILRIPPAPRMKTGRSINGSAAGI